MLCWSPCFLLGSIRGLSLTEVMSLEEGPGHLLVWFDQAGITYDSSAAAIRNDLETSYGVYALQDISKGQVLCR